MTTVPRLNKCDSSWASRGKCMAVLPMLMGLLHVSILSHTVYQPITIYK